MSLSIPSLVNTTLTLQPDGWIGTVHRVISPNCLPRPPATPFTLVVIHNISLPQGVFGGDDVLALFTNRLDSHAHPTYATLSQEKLSAHFFIRRNGVLIQFVSTNDIAWHAGQSMWRGQSGCNDFSIGIELEGSDYLAYEDQQYQQLADLILALTEQQPDLAVAGHADIAPSRKTDPGPAFNWNRLFAMIGENHNGRPDA